MENRSLECILPICNDSFTKFLHACVDDLIQVRLMNADDFNTDGECTTKNDYNISLIILKTLFTNAVLNPDFDIVENTKQLGTHNQKSVIECFHLRKYDIVKYLLKLKLLKYGNLLEDFDWRISIILGSSKYRYTKEPILKCTFSCVHDTSNKNNVPYDINFEVDSNMLNKLISVLDN